MADIDGDHRQDAITIFYDGIRWHKAPPPDSACRFWDTVFVNGKEDLQQHGGIAAGDIDGDGDNDISRMNVWYENADGNGRTWVEHANIPLSREDYGSWGLSGRAKILDMNGDGKNNLVEAECDLKNGRVVWLENRDGKGLNWQYHLIKDSTDGQDFHSLIVADFDRDGDLDVFSSGSNSSAQRPKAYIWENRDGQGLTWFEHILLDDSLALHESAAGDLDGDGDLDILVRDFGGADHLILVNQTVPNRIRGEVRGRGTQATLDGHPNWKFGAMRFAPSSTTHSGGMEFRFKSMPMNRAIDAQGRVLKMLPKTIQP